MARNQKKRVEKLEKHVDENGGNCKFTIVINPPLKGNPENEELVGGNQRRSPEPPKKPVQIIT